MNEVAICLPVARRLRKEVHFQRILQMTNSLRLSLSRLCRVGTYFQIRVVLNGPPTQDDYSEQIAGELLQLKKARYVNDVIISEIPMLGKVTAINSVVIDAAQIKGMVVIDEDILIPPQAFSEIERFLRPIHQPIEALCYSKSPILYYPCDNSFKSHLHFLLHPSVRRFLEDNHIFASNRPSGSMYAIHRDHLRFFPDPCNEADILSNWRIKISCQFIKTWYPNTFEEEVIRRKAHILTTRKCCSQPVIKPLEILSNYDKFLLNIRQSSIPINVRNRIEVCLKVMMSVIMAAEMEIEYVKHS